MRVLVGCYIVILFLLAMLIGCGSVKSSVDYFKACKADTECVARMQQVRYDVAKSVQNVVSTIPGANQIDSILGQIAGGLSFLLAGMVYGRRSQQKG